MTLPPDPARSVLPQPAGGAHARAGAGAGAGSGAVSAQPGHRVVAVYFVASPLNYLAARRIAQDHEAGARQVLVHYRSMTAELIQADEWDAVLPIFWPRLDPLPGRFGRVRRLLDNLERVAAAVGPCDELHLHSPVYDPEAVNYFVNGLAPLVGARHRVARLLPDGMDSLKRYPMRWDRRALQWLRKLRWLYDRRLNYAPFAGDRMGSDAPFVDRVYVLPGFSHQYDPRKVVVLGALVTATRQRQAGEAPRALVLGQPLAAAGFLGEADRERIALSMGRWLSAQGFSQVFYQPHPREREAREFAQPGYQMLRLSEPLESHLGHTHYDAVCGCASTALVMARQILGPGCRILSFGLECTTHLSPEAMADLKGLLQGFDVELHPADPGGATEAAVPALPAAPSGSA